MKSSRYGLNARQCPQDSACGPGCPSRLQSFGHHADLSSRPTSCQPRLLTPGSLLPHRPLQGPALLFLVSRAPFSSDLTVTSGPFSPIHTHTRPTHQGPVRLGGGAFPPQSLLRSPGRLQRRHLHTRASSFPSAPGGPALLSPAPGPIVPGIPLPPGRRARPGS